jgi:hypothetical protein
VREGGRGREREGEREYKWGDLMPSALLILCESAAERGEEGRSEGRE